MMTNNSIIHGILYPPVGEILLNSIIASLEVCLLIPEITLLLDRSD